MKSWIAGKHTLHHLLNVLWEFAISFQAWHNLMQEGARGKRELPECGPKWTPPIETMSKGLTGHLVWVNQRLIQSFEYVQNVVLKTWQYFSNSIKKMQHENPVQCWLNNHSNKPLYKEVNLMQNMWSPGHQQMAAHYTSKCFEIISSVPLTGRRSYYV